VEDTSADKLTETDHVITSLPTVKKKLCPFDKPKYSLWPEEETVLQKT